MHRRDSTKDRSCPANVFGSTGSLEGPTPGTPNPMQVLASLDEQGNSFGEDCLTLNIWTKPQTGEKSKAVLLWIFGGGMRLFPTQKIC